VGIALTGRTKKEQFAFGAQGSGRGWKTYAGGRGESKRFPGDFRINGSSVEMVIPWSYVYGPRRFRWFTSSSWFTQVAGTTHYAFDPIPNNGAADFPG
jgi:hypothetical protein